MTWILVKVENAKMADTLKIALVSICTVILRFVKITWCEIQKHFRRSGTKMLLLGMKEN